MQKRTGLHLTGTLTFVEADERYSIYHDRDGDEVYLAHGTARRLIDLDDAPDLTEALEALWEEFKTAPLWGSVYDTAAFRRWLAESVLIDESQADDFGTCADCYSPSDSDELTSIHNGSTVCESCGEHYMWCGDCEEMYPDGRMTSTLHEEVTCDGCRDRNYSWCESCDGYYHGDAAGDHYHEPEHFRCCDSALPTFTVANAGERLSNDSVTTVTLPAGIISDVGLGAIAVYLRNLSRDVINDDLDLARKYSALSWGLDSLGSQWQTKQGNYTKRLSRLAYKEHGLKVSPEVMSQVGTIASNHSREVDVVIDVTRLLNQPAEEFYHEDSCWFSTHYHGRCALKTNGGFALRTHHNSGYGYVDGRAWVMPVMFDETMDEFEPTFDTDSDAFLVFNGYGALEDYAPARILAHMTGMTYRKIELSISPMYINGEDHGGGGTGNGYLIAPEHIAERFTDGHVVMHVDQHSNLNRRILVNA